MVGNIHKLHKNQSSLRYSLYKEKSIAHITGFVNPVLLFYKKAVKVYNVWTMAINRPKFLRRKFTTLFPLWFFTEYLLLRGGMDFVNLFPVRVATWVSRRIGDVTFLILPARRRVARQNLDIVFGDTKTDGEKAKIALENFRHIAVSFMELFRAPKFVKTWEGHVTFERGKDISKALAGKKGLIVVMSHLGSWEYLAFAVRYNNCHTTILGKPIRNPYIYKYVKYLRKTAGLEHRDRDMGVRGVLRELRKNHVMAIAIDQWAGNEGLWVDFFGKTTSTTSLPARLAEKTGAPLIPAYCIRVKSGEYKIYVEPEVVIDANDENWEENTTRELNRRLEERIRTFPEQWLWTHKRWKDKRHGTKSKLG